MAATKRSKTNKLTNDSTTKEDKTQLYQCDQCDSLFETPLEREEAVGYYGDALAKEKIPCCPVCSSMSYVKVYECAECGVYAPLGRIVDGLCPQCRERNRARKRASERGEHGLAY